jgi:hypothetical protein
MAKNVEQVFMANPITVIGNTDVLYVVQSGSTDAAISGANLIAQFQTIASPLTTKGDLYTFTTVNARLPVGATNGQILQVASAAATGLAWSTATYPVSTTINQILYSSAANVVSGLATAVNGVLITSAGGVPSISQTLPAAVQGNITTVGTITTGVWNGTAIDLAHGGTNANLTASNGGIVWSNATQLQILAGTATASQVLLSGSNATPAWSTATYPSTTTINQILYSGANNVISGLTTANNGVLVTGNTGVPSILAGPGTTGQFLQSNAAGAPSWSSASFPTSVGAAGTILRSNGTNWLASTATFSDTYAASNLLYSNGANTVTGLATANNGMLVTSATGVPSILAGPGTTGNILQSNAAAAPSFSTATYPSVATTAGTLLRANGTNWLASTSTFADTYAINTILYNASANTVSGLATANSSILVTSNTGVPSWSQTLPAFTTSSITFSPTTGGIVGTTTNDNAAAGKVGEFISSIVAVSSVSLSNATPKDITSISLTAGDWDVWGNIWFTISASATVLESWTSQSSATLPAFNLINAVTTAAGLSNCGIPSPYARYSLSGTTTIFLSGAANFSSGTASAGGGIFARRVR